MLTILDNADLYTPAPAGPSCIVISGGKILAVLKAGAELPLKRLTSEGIALRHFDLAGKRLVPGFIDAHTHVTGGGGEDGAATKVPAPLLSDFTSAGVTSVIGLLGTDDVTRNTAELLAGVRALRELGLTAWCWTGGYHLPPTTLTGSVRSDVVNIEAIIGAGEIAISDHRSSQPTLDELLRVASDCHLAGLLTKKAGVLHLHLGDGPRGMELIRQALEVSEIPARVFQPTHVNRRTALFEEALDLAGRGCHIDITSFPVGPEEDAYPAAVALHRYFEAGLAPQRVSISSDGGGCLPVFDEDGRMVEMEIGSSSSLSETLTEATALGVPFEFALAAITSNIADHLRLHGKGHIRVGADADLVALNTQGSVTDVLANGHWMVRDGEALARGPFE
ncbi:MAG: beta-aspartyl-peptidase [Planctomycetes bacterium]|nr:beta-aspartyl-peptidase [Planctomycetota bacterium]MCP4770772.1 beta-aspartyl-peptidase [Planctomycetota bacterium]MCP4862157.1 beta-aspartyl-peptidase [Planctomycetota bacterium]